MPLNIGSTFYCGTSQNFFFPPSVLVEGENVSPVFWDFVTLGMFPKRRKMTFRNSSQLLSWPGWEVKVLIAHLDQKYYHDHHKLVLQRKISCIFFKGFWKLFNVFHHTEFSLYEIVWVVSAMSYRYNYAIQIPKSQLIRTFKSNSKQKVFLTFTRTYWKLIRISVDWREKLHFEQGHLNNVHRRT